MHLFLWSVGTYTTRSVQHEKFRFNIHDFKRRLNTVLREPRIGPNRHFQHSGTYENEKPFGHLAEEPFLILYLGYVLEASRFTVRFL